jgi:hypothetical protein
MATLSKSPWLPTLLATHLDSIMALFLTLPYGKFAHGIYRCADLIRFSLEKREPSQLVIKEESPRKPILPEATHVLLLPSPTHYSTIHDLAHATQQRK